MGGRAGAKDRNRDCNAGKRNTVSIFLAATHMGLVKRFLRMVHYICELLFADGAVAETASGVVFSLDFPRRRG